MRRKQALLYLSPALMDWLLFFVASAVFYGAGRRADMVVAGIVIQIKMRVAAGIVRRELSDGSACSTRSLAGFEI